MGGVKANYFMKLIHNAIEGAGNTRCDYEDALQHGGFDVGANGSFWESTRRGILAI